MQSTSLESATFLNATTVSKQSFYQATKLKEFNGSKVTTIGTSAFYDCPLQETLIFPKLTSISTMAFYRSDGIKTLDINVASTISASTMYGCTSLTTLILRKTDKVVTLANTNALANTPIASGTGYIYVPDDLVDSYKSASNWSTFASQIKALSELES